MRWSGVALGSVLLATVGCGFFGSGDPQVDTGVVDPSTPNPDGGPTATGPVAKPPASVGEVHPVFDTIGADGEAPRKLTVRFDRDVIQPDATGSLTADTSVSITPDVPGTWTWTSPSRLSFEPTVGFAPSTTYRIGIASLESQWGKLGGQPFAHTLETPAFEVTSVTRALVQKEHVDVDVVFSGPVDPSAEGLVTLEVSGRRVSRSRVDSGRNNRLRFRVPKTDLPKGDVAIDVRVEAGAKSLVDGGIKAGASRRQLKVDTSVKPMEIRQARVQESADGWYLDIVCHDAAVGEAQYYWDRESYESWYVSERCVLAPDALSSLQFTPEVSDAYIVEGRRGFRIFGNLPRGELTVRMQPGTFTVDGGVLEKEWEQTFTIEERTPRVELTAKQGRYLPKGSWGNLPIKHLNTAAVDIEIRQVPPQNLVFWMSDDDEDATARTSDLVATKRIAVDNPTDRLVSSWVDVGSLVGNDLQGLFEITVKPVVAEEPAAVVEEVVDTGWEARMQRQRDAERKQGTGDVSRVVLTDLQLVAKSDEKPEDAPWPDTITVWALGADDNAAAGGVDIDVVRASGFVMATCRTSADGSCELDMPDVSATDRSPPIALVARRGNDLTYLKFADLETPVSEQRVGGVPWTGTSPYKASLYGDRGVYRPGDTVHFGLVLRGKSDRAPKKPVPAVLMVKDPRGKLAKQVTLTSNAAGMASWDLGLQAFAPTGSWKAVVEIGGKTVTSWDFAVEEFVPERMKVEARMRGEGGLATEPGTVDVNARYLFGGSAEGSRVDVTCAIRPTGFRPKNNENLHYGAVFVGTDAAPRETSVSETSETLDASGEASVSCGGLAEGYPVTGSLVADVAVFEAGSGRSTRGTASVPVHPESFYIGLDTGTEKAGKGTDIRFTGKVVDWTGKAGKLTDRLDVTLYRLEEEYGWWWWDDRGEESYDLYLRRVQEDVRSVEVGADGSFSFTYTPRADGAGYLARVTSGKARTDFRIDGERRRYSWSSSSSQVDRTPRPAKPTSLSVVLPKEVAVGERSIATFDVPFDGRVLMTLETHELLTHEWIDVKAGQAEWAFAVESFVPNVYVSAFLVKDPHLDSPEGYSPERAFGVASVRVRPDDYRFDVKVDVPEEVRSNSVLTVGLDVGKHEGETWVTVAAVDEGILQLTRFESPDPIADVFPQHRLGIRTYETVGWSILMPAGTSSEHGGDGMGAGGRVQPVKPVALWSGLVKTDDKGKASVKLDVPQYRGELRVMVVAAGQDRVGSASKAVAVRDPLVLQTTLPRFLTQGDTFQVPVFVTNMSGKDRDVTVSMTAEYLAWPGMPDDPNAPSPVEFLGQKTASIRVEDGKSKTVAFQAKATALVGAAKFRVKVESDGLTSHEELDVPFAPSGPKSRDVKQVALTNGKLDLAPLLSGWLPTTEQSTVWVTPNPYGQAMGHLKHVIRYPHGCIEQTTSSTRPLLYVSSLVPAMLPEVQGAELEKMVMHGVDRVLAMQTPSGGFGYWPGDRRPTPWGTVYATHMLLDAKKLQYDVPQDRIDDALDYLEDTVRQSEGETRGFGTYQYSEPYAHYVLAMAGRGKKARIQTLIARLPKDPSGEDAEALYLLQAALYLAGDRKYEAQLRKPDASTLSSVRKNSWSFYSDLRRRGFTLSVYHDLFGDSDSGAEDLAKLVARGLEGHHSSYYTTQELVWGITGLGKRVSGGSADFKNIDLKSDGKKLEPMAMSNAGVKRNDPLWAVPRASERSLELDVGNAGSGKLYLVLASEGVKLNSTYETGGKGLSLARTYLDADGNPVDAGQIQLGDVVYTKVVVKNLTNERVQNIALVDRFAAGWEIENPRLGRSGVVDWVDPGQAWEADHMNLRDDRLELFGALEAGQSREVVYGLRAVTAGEFTAPPVEAEAMYDPSVWARQPGGKIVVQGPWADVLL
ncbi:MAG: MG2 domain-containing protein [Myxococcota bacterium]